MQRYDFDLRKDFDLIKLLRFSVKLEITWMKPRDYRIHKGPTVCTFHKEKKQFA